jgi:RimJ/RimL family protein N-acetyltransferase
MPHLFNSDIVLENERAQLIPLALDQLPILWPIASHTSLWEFTSAHIQTYSDFETYINNALHQKKLGNCYPFAIFDKVANCFAGSTRYGNISLEHKRVEIGWTWYHPSLQRTGLNRACKSLLLQFGFEQLNLNRIELKTSLLNIRSQKAILQLGATQEGLLRQHMINDNGSVRDTVIFSILKQEWPTISNTKLHPDAFSPKSTDQ